MTQSAKKEWTKPKLLSTNFVLECMDLVSRQILGYPFKILLRFVLGAAGAARAAQRMYAEEVRMTERIRPEDRPFEKDEEGEFVQKPLFGKFERSQPMSAPYLMAGGVGAEARYPFQVRTYTDLAKAPVCQDYPTYEGAAERVCELVKDPKCPLTEEPVIRTMIVKKAEPLELVTLLTEKLIEEGLLASEIMFQQPEPPAEPDEEAAGAVTL